MQLELITLLLGFPGFQVDNLRIEGEESVIARLGRMNTTFRGGSFGKESFPYLCNIFWSGPSRSMRQNILENVDDLQIPPRPDSRTGDPPVSPCGL